MFIVRFIRTDGKQEEEYSFHTLGEAMAHISVSQDNANGIYKRAEVIDGSTWHLPYVVIEFKSNHKKLTNRNLR